jgi:hypothetical protein
MITYSATRCHIADMGGERTLSKPRDVKKEKKKPRQKTIKEKREAKREKKAKRA